LANFVHFLAQKYFESSKQKFQGVRLREQLGGLFVIPGNTRWNSFWTRFLSFFIIFFSFCITLGYPSVRRYKDVDKKNLTVPIVR
jgi:hypothetical protein